MVLAGGVAIPLREAIVERPPERLVLGNFRGQTIPAVGGIVLLTPLLAADALLTLVALLRPGTLRAGAQAVSPSAVARVFGSSDHIGLVLVAVGFFALGVLDDLAGAGRARGLRGHARALREGIVTGGVIKAVGGVILAFAAAGQWEVRLHLAILDALLVALTANLINLLDTRPGRASKAFLAGWAPIAAFGWTTPYFPVSGVIAIAAVIWLGADLGERGMLGDGGSNLLGAVLGAGFALTLSPLGRLVALVALVFLNLASEKWSFSGAIDRVAPLRWLDGLGRAPE